MKKIIFLFLLIVPTHNCQANYTLAKAWAGIKQFGTTIAVEFKQLYNNTLSIKKKPLVHSQKSTTENSKASDEEKKANKELKEQVLKLQKSLKNPPYNPQSDTYLHWLTDQVNKLGK